MKKYISDYSKLKQNRLMHFQIGLILALGVALLCVNFTLDRYEMKDEGVYDFPHEEIITIPPTPDNRRKKMPPPPVIEEVEPKDIIEDIDIDPEPEPVIDPAPNPSPTPVKPTLPGIPKPPSTPAKPVTPPAPPVVKPPAPPEPPTDRVAIKFAEIMPRFKLMDDNNATEDEIQKYSDTELVKFINKNVKYPAIARENGIEGTAVVRFIVEKDGSMSGFEVLRDPGGGCGDAALKVLKKMPKWERIGRQNGRSVRVFYTLPIKFQLN